MVWKSKMLITVLVCLSRSKFQCVDPDAPPPPPQDPKPVTSRSKLEVPQSKEVESHSVEDLGDISSEFSVEVGTTYFQADK